MLWKLEGYLLIPHEFLHVVAHKLIGKRCSYRVGLLPLVIWVITYFQAGYPSKEYLYLAPLWHQALFVVWFLLFNYVASSCLFDLVKVGRLVLEKLRHQPPDYASQK